MYSHLTIGSNDIPRSKAFYDALMATLGGKPGTVDQRGWVIYSHNGGLLIVLPPIDGKPATHANGGTIGFKMDSAEQTKAWHDAGVANGGTSIEEPPGLRPSGLFLAYLRDPDGNKLCGLYRAPKA